MQIGVWFITLQVAPIPQDPKQGSLHFSLMQANLLEHSELIEHSGRQFGGLPIYSDKQEQDGEPPISRHSEFGPHGDGTQGLVIVVILGGEAKLKRVKFGKTSNWLILRGGRT